MIVNIHDTVGDACITREDGEQVYNAIVNELARGHDIDLDFTNVDVFASPFFNAAIGRLRKVFSRKDIEGRVHIRNISSVGYDVYRLVLENSDKYYGDQTFRKALDDILSEEGDSHQ